MKNRSTRTAFHPCMHGGPCQCGGGCGQQPLMLQPDYGDKEGDGESYMSVQALQSMRDHAEDLLNRVDHGTPLPDWAEAKLTRAAQSLNDVYEYMSHGKGQRLATTGDNMNRVANILREEGLLPKTASEWGYDMDSRYKEYPGGLYASYVHTLDGWSWGLYRQPDLDTGDELAEGLASSEREARRECDRAARKFASSRMAGVYGEVLLEDEVDFGRPLRIKGFAGVRRPVNISGFEYNSGHYRVDRKDGIYLELYSDDGGPTLYGNVPYNRYEGGDISMREVAEEIREDLEDGKMPVMFKRQTWDT